MIDLQLGDMLLTGDRPPPPKLAKALAVIANTLHRSFAREPFDDPEYSKRGCVLSSLAVRDFLIGIGFATARVAPVCTVIKAFDGDRELHSIGIGHPDDKRSAVGHWTGHMVVMVDGWLVDTTLYPAINRPAWRGLMPPMMAVTAATEPAPAMWGMPIIAHAVIAADGEFILGAAWLDNPGNQLWRFGPDAIIAKRRRRIVRALVHRFGQWSNSEAARLVKSKMG